MKLQSIGLGLLLVLSLSCKDDDEKKPRTREEFCVDWAEAACSDDTVSACQAADAESCRDTQEDACRKLVPEDFSDDMGQACIDAVKKAYEDADLTGDELKTVISLGDPCDKLIKGNKDEGEDCDANTDCDGPGGYVCIQHSDADTGTCQIPEVVGGGKDCSSEQKTCDEGFYCNGENCIESKDEGDDCTIQEQCGEAAFCNADKKCETKHKVSTACTSDLECDDGVCYEYEGEKTCTDRIVLGRREPLCEDLK
ncbi:MAG TPA: hypothetical protein VFG30_13975 [Polyangiales bacterium]|nr:hypothetical protein [Polyangiales bacterium]